MSLFIASLAFSNDLKNFDDAKIGVIAGSIFSVIAGGEAGGRGGRRRRAGAGAWGR